MRRCCELVSRPGNPGRDEREMAGKSGTPFPGNIETYIRVRDLGL